MFNPDVPSAAPSRLPSFEAAARSLKVEPIPTPVYSDDEIEKVVTSLGREPGGGLLATGLFMSTHRAPIILLAARNNVPAVSGVSVFTKDGGLLSYGANYMDIFRRSASGPTVWFTQGLAELGWREGRNLRIDIRWAAANMRMFAKELVHLQPDVILAHATPAIAALQPETTIPIVFVAVADPVGAGFVESLSRPGRNITGFANLEGTMAGKWLHSPR
jgi:hypothetical protein